MIDLHQPKRQIACRQIGVKRNRLLCTFPRTAEPIGVLDQSDAGQGLQHLRPLRPSWGIAVIQLDCLVRIGECFLEILLVLPACDEVLPLQIGLVGLGIRCGRTSGRGRVVAAQQSQLQSTTHSPSYFVLCCEDMTDIAVIRL